MGKAPILNGKYLREVDDRRLQSFLQSDWPAVLFEGRKFYRIAVHRYEGWALLLPDDCVIAENSLPLYRMDYHPAAYYEHWMPEDMYYDFTRPAALHRLSERFSFLTYRSFPAEE